MKRTIQLGSGLTVLFLVASSIRADVMPFLRGRDHRFDRPPAPKKVPVHIETSLSGPQVRLVIPRKFLSGASARLIDLIEPTALDNVNTPGEYAEASARLGTTAAP